MAGIRVPEDAFMAKLIVRNLPDDLVIALKQRAARRNHSAEQEHRDILVAALQRPRRKRLADVLAAMPDVGEDADFARDPRDARS
jgi:plasmid stability protein